MFPAQNPVPNLCTYLVFPHVSFKSVLVLESLAFFMTHHSFFSFGWFEFSLKMKFPEIESHLLDCHPCADVTAFCHFTVLYTINMCDSFESLITLYCSFAHIAWFSHISPCSPMLYQREGSLGSKHKDSVNTQPAIGFKLVTFWGNAQAPNLQSHTRPPKTCRQLFNGQ